MEKITTDKIQEIHNLLLKKNTPTEISQLTEVPVSTVKKVISRYFPHLHNLPLFIEHKKDIFKALQSLATGYIIQKMPYARFEDLIALIKILEDKIALLEGRSNYNIGVAIRIEDLVSQKEKMLSDLRTRGIPEHQLETEFQKLIALPPSATIPHPVASIEHIKSKKPVISQPSLF